MSIFNILNTLTLLMHAGLFWCLRTPSNSDMDFGIFNVRVWRFACVYTRGTLVYGLIRRTFVECTEFDSGEISGRAQSLARNGHPSVGWPRSAVLNFGFPERVLFAQRRWLPGWVYEAKIGERNCRAAQNLGSLVKLSPCWMGRSGILLAVDGYMK